MKKQLVLGVVLGAIVLGLGFAGSARAINDPIPGVDIIVCKNCVRITPSDLGVDSVGMLPTSPFYFFKQLSRGITRLFTFDTTARVQLELDILNQTVAEAIEVDKANPDDAPALTRALQNVTNAQDHLDAFCRRMNLSEPTEYLSVMEVLKDVDEKTALHVALMEQLNREHANQAAYATLLLPYFEVDLNAQRIFTVTVTAVNDAPALKQKAADGIAVAAKAIQRAEAALGQPVTFTATVTNSGPPADNSIFLACASGKHIDPAVLVARKVGPVPGAQVRLSRIPAGWAEFQPFAVTTATDWDGCFAFAGLTPGAYEVSIAGQAGRSLTVGADGTVVGGVAVTSYRRYRIDPVRLEINPLDDASGKRTTAAWPLQYSGEIILVAAGPSGPSGFPETCGVAGTSAFPETCKDVQDNAIADTANAKDHLARANEAFAQAKYGEAYGSARSAEALATGLFVAAGDLNGDGRPDDKVVPTPSPRIQTPRPSSQATVPPTVRPTPVKTATPTPSVTESATPTPTPTPTENPMGTATPTPTETGSAL